MAIRGRSYPLVRWTVTAPVLTPVASIDAAVATGTGSAINAAIITTVLASVANGAGTAANSNTSSNTIASAASGVGTGQGAVVDADTVATPGPASAAGDAVSTSGAFDGTLRIGATAVGAATTAAAPAATTSISMSSTVTPAAAGTAGSVTPPGTSALTSIATPSAGTGQAVAPISGAMLASSAATSTAAAPTPGAGATQPAEVGRAASSAANALGTSTSDAVVSATTAAAAGGTPTVVTVADSTTGSNIAVTSGNAPNPLAGVVVAAGSANATGQVDFDTALSIGFVLTADSPIVATGQAFNATATTVAAAIATAGTASTAASAPAPAVTVRVFPEFIRIYGTAGGAATDSSDTGTDFSAAPVATLAQGAGSTSDAHKVVTLHAVSALAQGHAASPTSLVLALQQPVQAGAPIVLPGRWVAGLSTGAGLHTEQPMRINGMHATEPPLVPIRGVHTAESSPVRISGLRAAGPVPV